ncbi:hypothetical protein FDF74_10230 [Clostridium niameyense]|uniref:Lipoprotein n=1 Tax=Clostridium niameyense TaxID=1622073 RepID=A0A6M0RCN5_9CLOT|nr:hypothetical protein [Clostridium niameyense]NEZ47567.1 hypothetical protein [Clostridium niameyense]
MTKILTEGIMSALAIIVGAIIGGIWSSCITKKATLKNEEIQKSILRENRKDDRRYNIIKIKESAAIIRLDLCTAIFQSIRSIKGIKDNEEYYPSYIPINKNYSRDIAILTTQFDLKEISYISQLYGRIEKINHDVKNLNYNDMYEWKNILIDYELLLKKIYNNNFNEILKLDIDRCSYKDLIDNSFIKEGYKKVLLKLEIIIDK